jgi:hypothetical protein
VARALQPYEFRDILEILPEDIALALRDDRNVAQTQGQQLLTASGIVRDVDYDVVYLLFRKKLFRSETAASPRLEKQYEFLGWRVHVGSRTLERGKGITRRLAYYPHRRSARPRMPTDFRDARLGDAIMAPAFLRHHPG